MFNQKSAVKSYCARLLSFNYPSLCSKWKSGCQHTGRRRQEQEKKEEKDINVIRKEKERKGIVRTEKMKRS